MAFSHLSFKVEVLFTSLVQKQNEKNIKSDIYASVTNIYVLKSW